MAATFTPQISKGFGGNPGCNQGSRHSLQWPPFVASMPRQIDCVMYSLSLAPKKPREAKVWAEIAEYMSIQDQTIVDERELLEEHQFLLELRPGRHEEGFAQHQRASPKDNEAVLAQREVRIRRLEYAFLQLRLRRAQLEASLLAKEVQAGKEHFSNALNKSSPSLSSFTLSARSAPMISRPSLRRVWQTPAFSPLFVPQSNENSNDL